MTDERTFETTSAIKRLTRLPQDEFNRAKDVVDQLEQVFPDMPLSTSVFRSALHLADILRKM